MSILAIVPARGGSKGIPYKNIMDINGYPLIYYVLTELLKIKEIGDIIVSTDSTKIKNVVSEIFGNKVTVMDRPTEFSTDIASSESVIEYVIENIDKTYDYTMFAQCTSPLTEYSDFINLINKVEEGFDCAAFYVEDFSFIFNIDKYKIINSRIPRQKMKPRKKEAGNAWIFKTSGFLVHKSRLFNKIGLCKIDRLKHFEIDRLKDAKLCSCILNLRKHNE